MMLKKTFFISFFSFTLCGSLLWAKEEPFSVLYTGDLHSSFEVRSNTYGLGGMARLKTAFNELHTAAREQGKPVLQLDAGDCSEGSIFFSLGAGLASFDLLNRLGYQAVAVGNHDWYSGPEILNKVLTRMPTHFSFLSANLNFKFLPEDNKLSEKIKRYEVFYLVDGEFLRKGDKGFTPQEGQKYFKVGVFGLSTNEISYQFFFDPVRLQNPMSYARNVVLALKSTEKVDVVIMLSHLQDEDDIAIAQGVSSIDLIIGGHSHNKVIPNSEGQALVIQRTEDEPGHETTWLAKSGEFGHYLGQVDLVYDGTQSQIVWPKSRYLLHSVDGHYAEDPDIKSQIEIYKQQLIKKYKAKYNNEQNIFEDHIADIEINLEKTGTTESYIGNFIVDAIIEKTKPLGVQFAFNNTEFLSHGLIKGPIHTADVYNILPLIYDPVKDAAWTIWTFNIDGASLKQAFNYVFMMEPPKFFDVAGLSIVYDPDSYPDKVQHVFYQGQELENDKIYKVAASEGIIKALNLLKDYLPGLTNVQDTQIEIFETLKNYFIKQSPIRADQNAHVSGRIRTVEPDLSVLSENLNVQAIEESGKVQISVLVQNLGYGDLQQNEVSDSKTDPTEINFYYDATPENTVDDIEPLKPLTELFSKPFRMWSPVLDDPPANIKLINKFLVPSLGKDQEILMNLNWDVSTLPHSSAPYTVFALLRKASGTGYVNVPSENEGAPPIRKFVKINESNLENNKARGYVYLTN